MSLKPGTRLGSYEIKASIGAGGMGEVYRATDSKLKRQVAIKVLTGNFASNSDRLARFEREAHLLASLNHPHIATIYGLEESEHGPFLVLELIEGQTLAEKIASGPLPVDETLDIARQIASALESAHDKGIIHRDLKPANVKVQPDGRLKVLDFGLAKILEKEPTTEGTQDLSQSPTITAGTTRDGMILGTAPYMSPEQARGKMVDKRTDIWSLGCVLFESLTGRRPFTGPTTTDVLAQIVSIDPDITALPQGTPDFLGRLLRRCLQKDPRRRLRDAGEMRALIEEFQSNPTSDLLGPLPGPSRGKRRGAPLVPWILVGVTALALTFSLIGRKTASPETPKIVSKWPVPLPAGTRLGMPGPGGRFDYSRLVAISPGGARIAYSVQDKQRHVEIFVKEIDALEPQPIMGTTDGRGPFFSPDGRWLGFLADGAIFKVALAGGSPQKICSVGRPISFDAAWSPDGETIVFGTDEGLWSVSASGGIPEPLTRPDSNRGEVGHHSPRFAPDGRGVLFTISETPDTHLALLSLETGSWEILIRNASQGMLVDGDRLVFARAGELLTAPYDAGTNRVIGSIQSTVRGVHTSPGLGGVVLTHFDLSDTGTLVYIPDLTAGPGDQLLWVDRNGNESNITSGPGTWVHPRISPDGRRISLDIHAPDGMRDVYLYDLNRGQMRPLTESGITWESEWRPGGKQIAVLSGAPAGHWSLFLVSSDFSGTPELLYRTAYAVPADWVKSGEELLFTFLDSGGVLGSGFGKLPLPAGNKPEVILKSAAQERHPRLSPDNRWIAYTANISDRREVLVQSYPALGPKYQVSIAGGGEPVWSPDGRELFFRKDDQMLVVDVDYEPFRTGPARVLFTGTYDSAQLTGHQHYDISADGRNFLMIKHGDPVGPNEFHVVLQWDQVLAAFF